MRLFLSIGISAFLVTVNEAAAASADKKIVPEETEHQKREREIKTKLQEVNDQLQGDAFKDLRELVAKLESYGKNVFYYSTNAAIRTFVEVALSAVEVNKAPLNDLLSLFKETQIKSGKDPRIKVAKLDIVAAIAHLLTGIKPATRIISAETISDQLELKTKRIQDKGTPDKTINLALPVYEFGMEMMKLKKVEVAVKKAEERAKTDPEYSFILEKTPQLNEIIEKAKTTTDLPAVRQLVGSLGGAKMDTCIERHRADTIVQGKGFWIFRTKTVAEADMSNLSLAKIEKLSSLASEILKDNPKYKGTLTKFEAEITKEKLEFFADDNNCGATFIHEFREAARKFIKDVCGSQEYKDYIERRKTEIKDVLHQEANGRDTTELIKKIDAYKFQVDENDARCAGAEIETWKLPADISSGNSGDDADGAKTGEGSGSTDDKPDPAAVDGGNGLLYGGIFIGVLVVGGGLAYWFLVVKKNTGADGQAEPKKRI